MEECRVVLERPLGPREGALHLEERNGAVTGWIPLLGVNG